MNDPIRVAIVDDHEMVRQSWKMVLQRDQRIEVIAECSGGEEAIECAGRDTPDIMLMDINMSPVDGLEATKKIAEQHPHIKIIGTSLNNQIAYVRNIIRLGAKGYVTKTSTSGEMLEAIIEVSQGKTYFCKDVRDKLRGNNLI